MKPIIPALIRFATCSLFAVSLTCHAAEITWGSPTNVSTGAGNSSDVSSFGTLIEAYDAVGNDQLAAATTMEVNGVPFTPTSSLLNADPKNGGTNDFSTGTNGGDPAYDTLLSTLEYGGGTDMVTLTLGDGDGDGSITGAGLLTIGYQYVIQIWYVDERAAYDARETPVGDGNGNMVNLNDQFVIGTFTADTTTQIITLESPDFGQAHINAYQIRELLPNPYVTLSTTAVDPVSGAYTVNVTFNKEVTGLEDSDFAVTNGSASAISPATGPASAYTVTLTPAAAGYVTVNLPADAASDTTAYGNIASNTLTNFAVLPGSEQATPILTTSEPDPTINSTYTVDITFDEPVTGLEAADFDVVNGSAANVLPASGPASAYTVEITAAAAGDVEVTLPENTVGDTDDGLPNLGSNTLFNLYTPPSIPSATLYNPAGGSVVDGPYTIEIEFSEDVIGLDALDFDVTNGTASNLTPAAGPALFYTLDITPAATGLVSVFLPAGVVSDDDGEDQVNTASTYLYANNLPTGTWTSGLLDLSALQSIGGELSESQGFFLNPKSFTSLTDFSLNDIPWTDGINFGTFDLSVNASGSQPGIKRGTKGAFGTDADGLGASLIGPGESVTLDTLVVSDLQGYLAGKSISNIQFVAIYLGNRTSGDDASINGLPAYGSAGGDTLESMRNDIRLASSAVVDASGSTGAGYSINGIDITFEIGASEPKVVSSGFNDSKEFEITFSGLDTASSYELRYSPDLITPFVIVPGTSAKVPAAATDTFTDPNPPLPGPRFYQLWSAP